MATKTTSSQPNVIILSIIIFCLVVITVSSVAHTSLALKDQSQGKSQVVRQHCLNGLQNAAIEASVCTMQDLAQFNNIMYIRETQGIKAAKNSCFSLMSEAGCRGLCVAAVNCYDLQ